MVEHYLAKVNTRVRFPPLAPLKNNPDLLGIFYFPKKKKAVLMGTQFPRHQMFVNWIVS